MASVTVDGYRHLIEPPERGDCQDVDCVTVSTPELTGPVALVDCAGANVLLVATYDPGGIRVCAACDERRLRAWLADE